MTPFANVWCTANLAHAKSPNVITAASASEAAIAYSMCSPRFYSAARICDHG
jgi:hypothetical protein